MSRAFLARRSLTGGRRMAFKRSAMRMRARLQTRTTPRARLLAQATFRAMANAKSWLGVESKFYDQKLIGSALTATTDATGGEHDPSATILLNTVVQGDGESNRDGRKITMTSIMVEGTITVDPQATQSTGKASANIFIALVLDKKTNGATINSEDVYKNVGAAAGTAANPFRNLLFAKRFRVLATRRFTIGDPNMTNDTGATGGVISNGLVKRFKIFKNLNGIQTIYSATTETVANITDNSLHLIAYTTSTALSPQINYSSRLRFVG